jgi:hypothetical protein
MTRITAHDVSALARLNAEVQRWNEAHPDTQVDVELRGPRSSWGVAIISLVDGLDQVHADVFADTLGDAINAALAAWKEARG